jgi:DNA-binding transcriptional regulator/RsmH inhibitor MraZ
VSNRIEIWDRTRHDATMQVIRTDYASLTDSLKDYGL